MEPKLSASEAGAILHSFDREDRLELTDDELESILYWLTNFQNFLCCYPVMFSFRDTIESLNVMMLGRRREKKNV